MERESCCTCATTLSSRPSQSAEKSAEDRRVSCCGRVICSSCINDTPRFATYCPYCQISSTSSLLPQGLRDPPSYTPPRNIPSSAPPPYTPTRQESHPQDDKKQYLVTDDKRIVADDTLHFLNHDRDSITSLSLQYGVPAEALRRANKITSDHLLQARKTILIPGEYYKEGVSFSPQPVSGEGEELRKVKIRRFMTSCKESDYNVALLYLEQLDYDLEASIQAYFNDDTWERTHQRAGTTKLSVKSKAFDRLETSHDDSHQSVTSDQLLYERKTILIPGDYYKEDVSVSPQPVSGQEEELRKVKIQRFMTSCKVLDYDVALLYLEQLDYDLEASILAYFDDDTWERTRQRAVTTKLSVKSKTFDRLETSHDDSHQSVKAEHDDRHIERADANTRQHSTTAFTWSDLLVLEPFWQMAVFLLNVFNS